jgi:general secretion pathway protein G
VAAQTRYGFLFLVCAAAFCGTLCAQAAIAGIRGLAALPAYFSAIQHAREAVLKEDLRTLRAAMDSFTTDKQRSPRSLDELIQGGYLKSIPEDPITKSTKTWVTPTSFTPAGRGGERLKGIHSGSDETGSDGQPYNTW